MNATLRQSLRPFGLLAFAAALGAIALLAILPASLPRTTAYDSGLPALGWLFWLLLTLALWWQTRGPDTFGAAALRGLRAFALLALAAALGLIAALAVWAVFPDLPEIRHAWFDELVKTVARVVLPATPEWIFYQGGAIGAPSLTGVILTIGLWLWMLRWKSWLRHLAVALPTAATLCYLAWDDTDASLLTAGQIAPQPARGEESAAHSAFWRSRDPRPPAGALCAFLWPTCLGWKCSQSPRRLAAKERKGLSLQTNACVAPIGALPISSLASRRPAPRPPRRGAKAPRRRRERGAGRSERHAMKTSDRQARFGTGNPAGFERRGDRKMARSGRWRKYSCPQFSCQPALAGIAPKPPSQLPAK